MSSNALFGGLLYGDRMTQFIYTDEAGHDPASPLTVVAGVLVHADRQLLDAERHIEEVLRAIPIHLRDLGQISIKSLYHDEKYRDGWSVASRKNMILNLVAAARKCFIPVAFSMVKRGRFAIPEGGPITQAQFDHLRAFATYVARIDKAIRDHRPAREVGLLIYEDMDYFREKLNFALNIFREKPLYLSEDLLRKTAEEREIGYFLQDGTLSVERIRKRILFLNKGDDPLLLLADAAAFSVRRYFGGHEDGADFIHALLGYVPNKEDFDSSSFRLATFG